MIEICERQKTQIENFRYKDQNEALEKATTKYNKIKQLITENSKIGDIVITFKDDKIEKVKFPKNLAKSTLPKEAPQNLLFAYNAFCDIALFAAKSTATPSFLKTAKPTPLKAAWEESPSLSPALSQPIKLNDEQSIFLQKLQRESVDKGITQKLDLLKKNEYKKIIASFSENQFQENILDKLFINSKGERAELSCQAIAHYFNCKKDFATNESDKKNYADFASLASSQFVKSFEDLSYKYARLAPSAPSSRIR